MYVWPFKRICINGWTLFVYSQIYSYLENELESPNVFSDDDPRLVIINSEAYAAGEAIGTNIYNNINKMNYNHNNINNMIYKSIGTQCYCLFGKKVSEH